MSEKAILELIKTLDNLTNIIELMNKKLEQLQARLAIIEEFASGEVGFFGDQEYEVNIKDLN